MNDVDFQALRWWKSSRSGSSGGACVEVAVRGDRWFVRDSKDVEGPVLVVVAEAWDAFLRGVVSGAIGELG